MRRFAQGAFAVGLFLMLLLEGAANSWAQELEPRTFANVPVGVNFLAVGAGYSRGNVLFDPTLPVVVIQSCGNIFSGSLVTRKCTS